MKYNGMYAEEFVVAWIKSEILMPRILLFKPENFYDELMNLKVEMEVKKNEISRKKKRKNKSA